MTAETQAWYTTEDPWVMGGRAIASARNSQEAIEEAGLDWEVKMSPVQLQDTGELVNSHRAIYRADSGEVLGMARDKGYTVLQNQEMFAFTDALIREADARYISGGELYGGRKVWMVLQIGEGYTVADEPYRPYLLVMNGHDVKQSFAAYSVSVRLYCTNQIPSLISNNSQTGERLLRLRHSNRLHENLDQAQESFRLVNQRQEEVKRWLEQTAELRLDEQQFTSFRDSLFGPLQDETPTRVKRTIELFTEVYDSERHRHGATAYALFNAATGFADHCKTFHGKDDLERGQRRVNSILTGPAAKLKTATADLISQEFDLPQLLLS